MSVGATLLGHAGSAQPALATAWSWRRLRISFDQAVARLPEALQADEFGILTQIALQQTFKAKLSVEFRRYLIFGACNPAFAFQALEAEPRVGLLVPCNVVLFEHDDRKATLAIIGPMGQLGGGDERIAVVARTIGERLARVARTLGA